MSRHSSHGASRRNFMRNSTLAGVGFWVASKASAADDSKSPNEKIRFACIGVGGKGESDSEDAGK
ncbi:MAG TPA: gfo/Idh/MocA family oxidoreductase, partial [Pirellulales bacterium]